MTRSPGSPITRLICWPRGDWITTTSPRTMPPAPRWYCTVLPAGIVGDIPAESTTTDLDNRKNPAISPATTAHSIPNVTQYSTRHGRPGGRSGRSASSVTMVGSGGPGCGGHTLKSSSSDTTKTIELGRIELVTIDVYSVAFVAIEESRLLTPSGIPRLSSPAPRPAS